jgi:DNA polymerase III subunit epsilon
VYRLTDEGLSVEGKMEYALIVDVETTGLDPKKEKIIEIGILEFGWEEGRSPLVTRAYSGLEDPGEPLSAEIQMITGIHDALLVGRKIDWSLVQAIFAADHRIVIAHNAAFDRSFLVRRPELRLEGIHWGCSMGHINWRAHGFKTRALNYLAADHGFANPFAHQALFDCATTLRLVTPYLEEIVRRSRLREYRLFADKATFEQRDALKARGYSWDAAARVWFLTVLEDLLAAEVDFLKGFLGEQGYRCEEVYSSLSGDPTHPEAR